MSANNITRLCELAFKEYARGIGMPLITTASIIAGFDDEEHMPTPRVVFACENAEPDGPADDFVWACVLEVQCVANCDDRSSESQHNLAGQVFSQLALGRYQMPDLVNAAAAAGDAPIPFQCMDIMPTGQASVRRERKYYSSMFFRVICIGTPAA